MDCTRLDNETTTEYTKPFNNLVVRYVYIVRSLNDKMAKHLSIVMIVYAKLSEESFNTLNFHLESYAASKGRKKDTTYVTIVADIIQKIVDASSTIDELWGNQ